MINKKNDFWRYFFLFLFFVFLFFFLKNCVPFLHSQVFGVMHLDGTEVAEDGTPQPLESTLEVKERASMDGDGALSSSLKGPEYAVPIATEESKENENINEKGGLLETVSIRKSLDIVSAPRESLVKDARQE